MRWLYQPALVSRLSVPGDDGQVVGHVRREIAEAPLEGDGMRAGRQRVHEQVEARVRARRQEQLGHHVGRGAKDVVGGELDIEQRRLLEEAAGVLNGDAIDRRRDAGRRGSGDLGPDELLGPRLRGIVQERAVEVVDHREDQRGPGRDAARPRDGSPAELTGEEPHVPCLARCALRAGRIDERVGRRRLRQPPHPPVGRPLAVRLPVGMRLRWRHMRFLLRAGHPTRRHQQAENQDTHRRPPCRHVAAAPHHTPPVHGFTTDRKINAAVSPRAKRLCRSVESWSDRASRLLASAPA